jgi:chromosomal replication initiation ATPase DnaA
LATQLTFDLELRPALGREDFLVGPSNAAAVALIDQWPRWPSHAAVVVGPRGSGKSHLAQVWRARSHASATTADALTVEAIPTLLQNRAVLLEDVDLATVPETALFHLLNFTRESGGHVLLTASNWDLSMLQLPDLATRLNTLPAGRIKDPDDALLRGVLVKLFADRQIAVDEALINYLVTRMPRSLDAARTLVDRIDKTAMEQGVEVTRSFASKILVDLENPTLF